MSTKIFLATAIIASAISFVLQLGEIVPKQAAVSYPYEAIER